MRLPRLRAPKPALSLCWAGCVVVLTCLGCRPSAPPPPSPNEIARVGNVSISRDAFEQLLRLRAADAPEKYATLEAREQLLDELVRREAEYVKATQSGFDQRPDVREAVRRFIAGKYEEELRKSPTHNAEPVSQKEIEDYYNAHTNKYLVAEQARGAMLLLKVPFGATPEKRGEYLARAQDLLAKAKAASAKDFAALVAQNSEDPATRFRAGDLGWATRGVRNAAQDPAVLQALFQLPQPGDFAPLITTPRGIYIVKLVDKHPAHARPLREVAPAITYAVQWEHREADDQKFYAAMEAGLNITINRALLQSIQPPKPATISAPSGPGVAPPQK